MIPITYKKHQIELLKIIKSECAKIYVIPTGRRWGKTHFFFNYALFSAAKDTEYQLWGDTVTRNLNNYMDRFGMKVLKKISRKYWRWNKTEHNLYLFDGKIEYRSADRPENWEGFGYKKIYMNEAGIILRNKSLMEETVLPMLLEYDDWQLYLFGTPKGQISKGEEHYYYQMYLRAVNGEKDYLLYEQTTYDNKSLNPTIIKQLEDMFDPVTAEQELYGKFINKVGMRAIYTFDEKIHVRGVTVDRNKPIYLSFDFNVNPFVCLIIQRGKHDNGKEWIYYIDEIYMERNQIDLSKTFIENICKIIKERYGNVVYKITGDSTSKKDEVMQRRNVNVYTHIISAMGLTTKDLYLPNNPSVDNSLEQCNAMLSKTDIIDIRFSGKCKELIRDFNNVKLNEYGDIDKGKDKRRSHLLDAFRYDLNTWHHDFIARL